MQITPVILCGGAGTRLWPLSRKARPKQLLALTGPETMLQATLKRASGEGFAPAIIVANQAQAEEIERQTGDVRLRFDRLVLEPSARGTAPAIALAAALVDPDALLLVMPSDHVVADEAAFRRAVIGAAHLAADDWLVTFGVKPHRAETGYGYIEQGEALGERQFKVARFLEKPDAVTAEALLAGGRHAWNAGIFLLRAGAYLDALKEHAPAIREQSLAAAAQGSQTGRGFLPDAEAFAASPSDSIDYAVMEKAARIAVVPVDMGWSDVGSWDALYEAGQADDAGNVVAGEVLNLGSSNSLLRSEGPSLVTIGVEDLIVVAMDDVVLVARRGESQKVKEALEKVKWSRGPDADSLA